MCRGIVCVDLLSTCLLGSHTLHGAVLMTAATVSDRTIGVAVAPPRRRRVLSSLWAVAEVRWAAAATLLFALGGIAQLAGAPAPVFWALYLACYATGGVGGLQRQVGSSSSHGYTDVGGGQGGSVVDAVTDEQGLVLVLPDPDLVDLVLGQQTAVHLGDPDLGSDGPDRIGVVAAEQDRCLPGHSGQLLDRLRGVGTQVVSQGRR